jgi:hypothetical protein
MLSVRVTGLLLVCFIDRLSLRVQNFWIRCCARARRRIRLWFCVSLLLCRVVWACLGACASRTRRCSAPVQRRQRAHELRRAEGVAARLRAKYVWTSTSAA